MKNTSLKSIVSTMFAASTLVFMMQMPLEAATQIAVQQGILRGTDADAHGVVAFKGVPYAKSPIGALRWMPPQPVEQWDGVREAQEYASQSAQTEDLGVFAAAGGSEDCLYLNIFYNEKVVKEAQNRGEKLPVFVWIHGGALNVGSSNDYDASALTNHGKVIVVTVNYRVGILGAFAHPVIDVENHAKVNYGMMDQTLALQWIHDNIGSFGGDKENVTIAGESSGGQSILWQMTNPHAKGLFQQAISMSGNTSVWNSPFRNMSIQKAEEKGIAFAKAAGLENATAEQLRALTTEEVLKYQKGNTLGRYAIDGDTLPDEQAKLLKEGKFNRVKVFVNGTVRDEGRFFAGMREYYTGKVMDEADFYKAIRGMAADLKSDPTLYNRIVDEYKPASGQAYNEAFANFSTDSYFAVPASNVNRWVSQYVPTYAYEFNDAMAPGYLGSSMEERAAHTYELPYLFPGFHGVSKLSTALNKKQQKLSDEMVQIWARPNTLLAQNQWKPFDNEHTNNYYRFETPKSHMIEEDFDTIHRRAFWQGVGIEYGF